MSCPKLSLSHPLPPKWNSCALMSTKRPVHVFFCKFQIDTPSKSLCNILGCTLGMLKGHWSDIVELWLACSCSIWCRLLLPCGFRRLFLWSVMWVFDACFGLMLLDCCFGFLIQLEWSRLKACSSFTNMMYCLGVYYLQFWLCMQSMALAGHICVLGFVCVGCLLFLNIEMCPY
mgnify:CR=1 FL=1